jgi:hypothetical protein
LIEEAIELSLRPLSGEDPFNNKPEVQGSWAAYKYNKKNEINKKIIYLVRQQQINK